jgi:hypothetical protein
LYENVLLVRAQEIKFLDTTLVVLISWAMRTALFVVRMVVPLHFFPLCFVSLAVGIQFSSAGTISAYVSNKELPDFLVPAPRILWRTDASLAFFFEFSCCFVSYVTHP